jgi:phage terminase large subunit-like protein
MTLPPQPGSSSSPEAPRPDGVQEPRVFYAPPAARTIGPEAIDLCSRYGVLLDPWQQFCLNHGLGIREDGIWASRENAVIVPRQNGKGEIILARSLVGLFLLKERLILHTAHEFKTAREGFMRLKAVIDGNYDLRRRVRKINEAHGEEGIELNSGQRLRVIARSQGSGRGFTCDCLLLDEAYYLDERHMGALLPTVSAVPNPQLWYFSSAPLPESVTLRVIRGRGLALAGLQEAA